MPDGRQCSFLGPPVRVVVEGTARRIGAGHAERVVEALAQLVGDEEVVVLHCADDEKSFPVTVQLGQQVLAYERIARSLSGIQHSGARNSRSAPTRRPRATTTVQRRANRDCKSLDRLDVTFDDDHSVADAGLVLTATLAQHLGLRELFDECVDLGEAPGRANVGHKAMTLIHSVLADGDCIDDVDALRAGATASVLGHAVVAPSTLGTFLRSFTWGHARQLDRVSGQLLGRAWSAGAGPGAQPVTIDVDSTICETYGLAKQGGVFGHTKVRGYHPLVAVIAGTGDVVHCRLRGGNAYSGQRRGQLLGRDVQPGPRRRRCRAVGAAGRLRLLHRQGGRRLPPR